MRRLGRFRTGFRKSRQTAWLDNWGVQTTLTLQVNERGAVLEMWNDTAHLSDSDTSPTGRTQQIETAAVSQHQAAEGIWSPARR